MTSNVHHTSTSVAFLSLNNVNTLTDKGACFYIQKLHTCDPKLAKDTIPVTRLVTRLVTKMDAQNGISPAYAFVGHSAG